MRKINPFLVVLAMIFSVSAQAIDEEQIVASKKCDEAKIKSVGGKGVLSVKKSSWEGSYVVFIDNEQITFTDLLQKLAKAGCN